MKSRTRSLLDKSIAAMVSALEIYNKPDFKYREETYSVLAVNAWELLLKARILQLANNRISAITKYEKRRNADGTFYRKQYQKKNRSGNPVSVGLFEAWGLLENKYGDKLRPKLRKNLEFLVEIRDNAIHFFNKGFGIEKRVQELATANLKNYVNCVRQWFGVDFSEYNLFIMPLAFFRDFSKVDALKLNSQERKLISFLDEELAKEKEDLSDDFNLAVRMDIQLQKVKGDADTKVVITKGDPDAIPVTLSEQDIRNTYPWDYSNLSTRLKKRYKDFKMNAKYHQIRKVLERNEKYCKPRFLDPGNPKSQKKNFYNSNILQEFDQHYEKTT